MRSDRELIALARTSDLTTIANKMGRKSQAILKTAKRLGLSIRGSKTIR
jgi:ribosomal protein L32E